MSSTKVRGGFPSGPCHEGPPEAVVSTNKAFNDFIKATGREMAIVSVIGVTITEIARKNRIKPGGRSDVEGFGGSSGSSYTAGSGNAVISTSDLKAGNMAPLACHDWRRERKVAADRCEALLSR